MANLFAGVQNFTPAFTAMDQAIELGANLAGAFTSGVSAGKGGGGGGVGGGGGGVGASELNRMMSGLQGSLADPNGD
jgi:hypothetical protein